MRVIVVLFLLSFFSTFASAENQGQLSPEQAIQMMRAQAEVKAREEDFNSPKKPAMPKDRIVKGSRSAPIQLVEYSDFQCPYCSRGADNVETLRKKYGKKLVVMFKHLPLNFHQYAMPAAKFYEAIALQSADKAHQFHDKVFKEQPSLTAKGLAFLEETAKDLKVNMEKLKKDAESDVVKKRIEADMAEAKDLGFSGTPGYVVAGVRFFGAYPPEELSQVIDRRLAQKK